MLFKELVRIAQGPVTTLAQTDQGQPFFSGQGDVPGRGKDKGLEIQKADGVSAAIEFRFFHLDLKGL
jgi:hypothetical protein